MLFRMIKTLAFAVMVLAFGSPAEANLGAISGFPTPPSTKLRPAAIRRRWRSALPTGSPSGVIANATFDATGARLYRMPMTPARASAALRDLKNRDLRSEPHRRKSPD